MKGNYSLLVAAVMLTVLVGDGEANQGPTSSPSNLGVRHYKPFGMSRALGAQHAQDPPDTGPPYDTENHAASFHSGDTKANQGPTSSPSSLGVRHYKPFGMGGAQHEYVPPTDPPYDDDDYEAYKELTQHMKGSRNSALKKMMKLMLENMKNGLQISGFYSIFLKQLLDESSEEVRHDHDRHHHDRVDYNESDYDY